MSIFVCVTGVGPSTVNLCIGKLMRAEFFFCFILFFFVVFFSFAALLDAVQVQDEYLVLFGTCAL